MSQSFETLSTSSTQTLNAPFALPDDTAHLGSSNASNVPTQTPVTKSASRFSGTGWHAQVHNPEECFLDGTINPETCIHADEKVNSNFEAPGYHTAADPKGRFVLFLRDATLAPEGSNRSILLCIDGDNGPACFVDQEQIAFEQEREDSSRTLPEALYDDAEEAGQRLWFTPIVVRSHAGQ